MHIQVDASAAPVRTELVEADDFRAFDIVVKGSADIGPALAELGSPAEDGEHVFVEPDRVRALAGARASDPEWLEGFEKMTAYAGEHGWLDGAGRIRAHVVSG